MFLNFVNRNTQIININSAVNNANLYSLAGSPAGGVNVMAFINAPVGAVNGSLFFNNSNFFTNSVEAFVT